MTKVEHERAPERNPVRQHEHEWEEVAPFGIPAPERQCSVCGEWSQPDAAAIRPPPEHAAYGMHWLKPSAGHSFHLAAWDGESWWLLGNDRPLSPNFMAFHRWRYIAPCQPSDTGVQGQLWKLFDAVEAMYEDREPSRWTELYKAVKAVRNLKANNS